MVGLCKIWGSILGKKGSLFFNVLVTTCLGRRLRINFPSSFLKMLKLSEKSESNFKIFKNHEGDLSQKLRKPNMWLLVNHTKPTNTFYWNWYILRAGNYKSASGKILPCQWNGKIWPYWFFVLPFFIVDSGAKFHSD